MKILVTGGQGFVGSYICQELLNNDHYVISIDNYSKYGKISRPQDTHKNFTFIKADVIDKKKFHTIAEYVKPDIIVASAALISGVESYNKIPYTILNNNNKINSTTIEICKKHNINRIIMLSTLMVYENLPEQYLPASDYENFPAPTNSYSVHKYMSEILCKAAQEQFNLNYTILRLGNAVGVGEDKNKPNSKLTLSHVIPDLVRKIMILKQDPVEIIDNPHITRSFINGKDIARAVNLVINNPTAINQTYNITTQYESSILEVATIIWNKINPSKPLNIKELAGFKNNVNRSWGTTSKAKYELGFVANISLEKSIEEVIEYIKANG